MQIRTLGMLALASPSVANAAEARPRALPLATTTATFLLLGLLLLLQRRRPQPQTTTTTASPAAPCWQQLQDGLDRIRFAEPVCANVATELLQLQAGATSTLVVLWLLRRASAQAMDRGITSCLRSEKSEKCCSRANQSRIADKAPATWSSSPSYCLRRSTAASRTS